MACEYEEQRMPRELQDLRRGKEGTAAEGGGGEQEKRTVGSSLCSASYSIYSLSSFVTRRWQRKLAGKAGYLLRSCFRDKRDIRKCPRCDLQVAEMLQKSRECFGIRTRTRLVYASPSYKSWKMHEMNSACLNFCFLLARMGNEIFLLSVPLYPRDILFTAWWLAETNTRSWHATIRDYCL